MNRLLRKTVRRGFCAEPRRLRRRPAILRLRWRLSSLHLSMSRLLSASSGGECLARLAPHHFVEVANTLALVGLRWPQPAHVGGELADELSVSALDHDLRGLGTLDGDAFRDLHVHGMREADVEDQLLALNLRVVADALDVETLVEAARETHDHVVRERAVEPVHGSILSFVAATGEAHLLLGRIHLDRDGRADPLRELLALGLDRQVASLELRGHTLRQDHRFLAHTRHVITKPCKGTRRPRSSRGTRGPTARH